jgi:superfamily II DNA or RNA helicase
MELRSYQKKAYDRTIDLWNNGHDSALLVLPTGTGKTIVFSHLVQHMSQFGRAMVLAHRGELVFQAKDKIEETTGLRCDIEMAEYEANEASIFSKAPVVVGTVQTQIAGYGRMKRFKPDDFSLLVIDEAHHSTACTYKRIIDYYGQNPKLKVLGVTATPDRSDKEALGKVFQTCAMNYQLPDAVRDGWLVPVKRKSAIVTDYDLSNLHTVAGDFHKGELSDVLENAVLVDAMSSKAASIIQHRPSLIFCETVDQAKLWNAKLIENHDIASMHIDGDTPKDERAILLEDFAAGRYTCMTNVGIATEGFDMPGIEIVVMARPTKSRSLYCQMLGRGTRPSEDIARELGTFATASERREIIAASSKPSMLVVDFVGNTGRHQVVTAADVLGGKYSEETIAKARDLLKETEDEQDVEELLDEAEEARQAEIAEERRLAEQAELKKQARIRAKAQYAESAIENLFDVMGCKPPAESLRNKGRRPTMPQKQFLEKHKLWHKDMTFKQAHALISSVIKRRKEGLCSPRQAAILRRFNYSTEITFEAASQIIDAIAKNNWRRPA